MKDEKIGITCEEALKAFSDLGEALRKEMVEPEKDSSGIGYKLKLINEKPDWGYTNGTPRTGNDWKTLNVNDLSDCPDILVGDYEFQFEEYQDSEPVWITEKEDRHMIFMHLKNDIQYRYRPTPTKKSHEELAEEYAVSIVEKLRISQKFNIDALFQHIHFAFIAGRKSMESQS